MATIPFPGGLIRHARKVVAFDGGANNGLLDDPVTLFARTGDVLVVHFVGKCTETLVLDGCDTVKVGPSGDWRALLETPADGIQAGRWLNPSDDGNGGVGDGIGGELLLTEENSVDGTKWLHQPFALSEDIVLTPLFTA